MNRISPIYLSVLMLLLCNNSFAQRLIYDQNIPVEKIRVVLEQARGGSVSEMLTDLEYIPLKSGKADLIDYISDIQVLGDKIGIISSNKGFFYLYAADGTFIKKITNVDKFKPAGKANSNLFYGISKEDNWFILRHDKFNVKVDSIGTIIDTVSHQGPSKEDEFGQQEQGTLTIGETRYSYWSNFHDAKRKRQDILLKNDSAIIQYNMQDTIGSHFATSIPFSKVVDNKAYLTIPFHYKFFALQEEGIHKIYELVFPLRNTMPSYSTNPEIYSNFQKSIEYLGQHRQMVYGIGRIFSYKDYLIFFVGRFENPMWLAYDLKTQEVLSLSNIVSDKSNDFLDYFDVNNIFLEGDYLYSFIYPSQVRAAINKSADERHTMRKEFLQLEKFNNPILVRFKLK